LKVPSFISLDDEKALQQVALLAAEGASAVPKLLELFQHKSWALRRAIVTALSRGDAAVLEQLSLALVTSRAHEPTIAGIVDALAAASPSADPLVRRLLTDSDRAVLCDAIQIAGRRGSRTVVPRLIELTQHVDDNVVLSAVEALGRIGGTEAIERLISLAEGDNFFRAFPAIEVLGASRETSALPTLQRLLKKPLYATEAARAIGRIGSITSVEALVSALATAPDTLVRVIALSLSAIQEAVEQGLGPASALSRAVRHHAPAGLRTRVTRALLRADAAETVALGRVLIWLGDEESVAEFIPLLGTSEEMTHLAIQGLRELSALDDARVLHTLVAGGSELRARLLPALSGSSAAESAIAACLEDPQAHVRALACHALSRGSATNAVPVLFRLLRDADFGVVHAAVGAIQSLGSAETESLAMAAAASSNESERRAALRIVLYFGYPASLRLAREALASSDERLRDVALGGLPALDEPDVPAILMQAAQHESPRTRASAVRALGHTALSAETERLLLAALEDPDAWVRYYACQSLGKLGVSSALPLLVAKLQDPAGQVKMAAVEALAAMPGAAARSALSDAAASDNPDVRRAAVVGIGTRSDPALREVLLSALNSQDSALRMVATSSIANFEGAEADLERIGASDADASVRHAAIELLANRAGAEATSALVRIFQRDSNAKDALAALGRNVDARIPSLLSRLADADDLLARGIVAVLSRAETRAARAALDVAFESGNPATRRATARALGLIADTAANASLARAATLDPDPEVRRICAAAIT
jgi:HEAT repeat protein